MRDYISVLVLSLTAAGLLTSCSGGAQRTAYESVQSTGQQDCRRDPNARCPQRQDYDEYQRERKALESGR